MIYGGRECEIVTGGGHHRDGHYCFVVEIIEGGEVIDRHPEAIPMERLRSRADENATTVAVERDNAVQEALARAEGRFRDIVDIES